MSQAKKLSLTGRLLPKKQSMALVAVGSNTTIGKNTLQSTVDRALEALRAQNGTILSISRYFSTPAFPPGSSADYINAALLWETELDAPDIIAALHQVEKDMGRVRRDRWGARTMDLDLIAVEGAVLPNAQVVQRWMDLPPTRQQSEAPDQLLLPHPRVQDRAFVLVPLCDIAPDWTHPLLGRTAREMRDALPQAELDSVKPLETREKRL